MKSRYEELEIQIFTFVETDIVRTSPTVDGDETKYPIPDDWTTN